MSDEPADEGDWVWRGAYAVFFRDEHRPTLLQVESAVSAAGKRLVMQRLEADDDGYFDSVFVEAPEDRAALAITFETGGTVAAEAKDLAHRLRQELDAEQRQRLQQSASRLNVVHLEHSTDQADDPDDDFNPTSLMAVLHRLERLTRGVTLDPDSGEVL